MSSDREFVEEYKGLVFAIAQKVQARHDLQSIELDDLVGWGLEGLMHARERFDPERGVQFNTFAYYRIQGAMLDGVRKSLYVSRRAYQRIRATEAALMVGEEVGEQRAADPSVRGDVARTTEQLHQTLSKLTAGFLLAAVGQDETLAESPEDELIEREGKVRLRGLVEGLDERERALIEGFYFEGRRFDEVAEELGISKSWASRIHTKALGRLRDALTASE